MGAMLKMCRSANEKMLTAAPCGHGGFTCPENSTHQLADTVMATPKLRLRPWTDRHTTCCSDVGLQGNRDQTQRSDTELLACKDPSRFRLVKVRSTKQIDGEYKEAHRGGQKLL